VLQRLASKVEGIAMYMSDIFAVEWKIENKPGEELVDSRVPRFVIEVVNAGLGSNNTSSLIVG